MIKIKAVFDNFFVESLDITNHDLLSELLSSGVRSKVVKGQRTYRLFAGVFVFPDCTRRIVVYLS